MFIKVTLSNLVPMFLSLELVVILNQLFSNVFSKTFRFYKKKPSIKRVLDGVHPIGFEPITSSSVVRCFYSRNFL